MTVVIIPVGLPGLGKSTLLLTIKNELETLDKTVCYLSKDSYTTDKRMFTDASKACNMFDYIMIDKCNEKESNRDAIMKSIDAAHFIIIDMMSAEVQTNIKKLSLERIKARTESYLKDPSETDEPKLKYGKSKPMIVGKIFNTYKPPELYEHDNVDIYNIDPKESPVNISCDVVAALMELEESK